MRRLIAPLAALLVALTLALPTGGIALATSTPFNFGNVHMAKGTSTFPSSGGVSIASGASFTVNIDMAGTSNTGAFSVLFQSSTDGGATWRDQVGASFPGGAYSDEFGQTQTVRPITCSGWPGGIVHGIWTGTASATVSISGTLTS